MIITAPRPSVKLADPPHDDLACGVLPETSCLACRAAFDGTLQRPRTLWSKLTRRFPVLGRLVGAGVQHEDPPKPRPDNQLFLAFVAILADEDRRAVVMAALGADVATIARLVREEGGTNGA